MSALKLRAIGNSVGVVLPKEVLARLRVGEGDNLYAVETPEGVILTPLDPTVADQMRVARDIMHRYRNTLAALAK
jgi:putative addiction module antidote